MSGYGERTDRTDDGLTEIKSGRLALRAVGWNKGQRFPTNMPKGELIKELTERKDVTAVELATITSFQLMESKDERAKGIGTKCVIAMERQNQIDDLAAIQQIDPLTLPAPDAPQQSQAVQVNVIMPDNGRGPLPEIHVNGNGSH